MTLRHITIDWVGRVYEITNMFDEHERPVIDPTRASTCVIKLNETAWRAASVEHVPIYTVH